jgi:ferredoxin
MLGVDLVLIPIGALMVVITAGLVRWAADARSPERAGVVLFLFAMMAAMFVGALVYYAHPGTTSLVEGLWLSAGLMSASVFPLIFFLLARVSASPPEGTAPAAPGLRRPLAFVTAVVGLVLLNEFLMGWTFQIAAGGSLAALDAGPSGSLNLLVNVLLSPWFIFTMAAEMALAAFLLRDRLTRPLLVVVGVQALVMFLSPPALSFGPWVGASILLGSAVMIGLVVYLMEFIYRNRELNVSFASYGVRLLSIYAVMMAGLFLWLQFSSPALFAVSLVLEMVLYFEAVLRPERFDTGDRIAWQMRPRWAFELLLAIFVAELFMGAVLDRAIQPGLFAATLPALPLGGSIGVVLSNAVSNGFWFVALVTGSTWFLAMMGVEMGALVYFKFRETRHVETRMRLLLMMGCYGVFAVFFPSVYYSSLFPNLAAGTSVPFLGWSMGIGSAPLVPAVFGVVLVTYAATGALSVLFGRRAICATFCTAALMYQGTTIDAMRSFNHTSPVAHKFLGSRFSTAYSVTLGIVMVSLAGTSTLSYLNGIGLTSVTFLGADPTVFLFALSFGVLWYVLFVTIPYAGNYNCVTMGWCYTGNIAGAFSRLGFFKLKVKDKSVCVNCTTLDCARSCPVGLVDMVGHFRTRGEFRSSKCCGVGNCVGACPYDNLYIHDVRHWVRRRLHLPEVRVRRGELPMLPARHLRPNAVPHSASPPSTSTVSARSAPP